MAEGACLAAAMKNEYDHWRQRATREPTHAVAHFNWGWWAARTGRYEEAVDAYQLALRLRVPEPEEAMTNLAALYSDQLGRPDLAREWLDRAIHSKPDYYPAHFNLGHLAEQLGDRPAAMAGFEQAALLRANDPTTLGRLLETLPDPGTDDSRLKKLRHLAGDGEPDSLFSLARVEEHLGRYEAAWSAFAAANEADRRQWPTWPEDTIRERYRVLREHPLTPLAGADGPVFIVGMFRTGSTLLEQMLAGHPDFMPLGESNFWPRQVRRAGGTMVIPGQLPDGEKANALSEAFRQHLRSLGVHSDQRVTDKRPDNLYHLPLIARSLPSARFVITERDWRDTLVSVFGTRLHPQHGYACDVQSIRGQLQRCSELASHWSSQSPNRVYRLSYEAMMAAPKEELSDLLYWLGAEWHDDCLRFYERDNAVRTASVWQVREPLHAKRMGRWKHYEAPLRAALGDLIDQPLDHSM